MPSRPSRRLFDALGTDRPAGLWRRVLGGAAAVVALAAVFASYLNPHLALELATRVWACF
jgi:hypothetical protein